MTHHVSVQAAPRSHTVAVRRAALRTLALAKVGSGEVTIRLTDEAEMRQLNNAYAQSPRATDVLSFPSGDVVPDSGGIYYGDVAIALPVASAQARAAGHDLRAELALLTIHGVLHLLGHDHADEAARAAMWKLQDEILNDLGSPIRSPQGET
jgi:probable rRNA maturation factor